MNANENHGYDSYDDGYGQDDTGDAIAEEFTELFGVVSADRGPDDHTAGDEHADDDYADDDYAGDGVSPYGTPPPYPTVVWSADEDRAAGHKADVDHADVTGDEDDDEDDESAPVPVDPPGSDRVRLADRIGRGERRAILPPWAKSLAGLRSGARWVVGHYAHTAAFHGVRVPVYATRLAVRAPVGALRVVAGGVRWLGDAEGVPVRQDAVRRADAEMYLKLIRHRDGRVRARSLLATFTACVSLVVALLMASGVVSLPRVPLDLGILPGSWSSGLPVLSGLLSGVSSGSVSLWWPLLALLVGALGVVGSPADKPIVGPAVLNPTVTRLTSNVVIRALGSLGIAEINKVLAKSGPEGIHFPAPITRDGPGWRADVDLPFGVTVGHIIDRRAKLASGLRRPLGCVWPEAAPEIHEGRLVLWVGDEDMAEAKQPAWPLARSGRVSLFKAFAFGTDSRGRVMTITLMFASMLIGSVPRMGKTFAMRLILLAAALDPRAWIIPFDLKGTGDHAPLAPVAHRYRAGDDAEDIAYGLAVMREMRTEMRRRTKVIRELPREVCPENKVTDELASRKSYALHPIVIGVDECQIWFEHPEHGKEFEEICTDLVKRGPALGICLILATQRVDAKSIPTGISKNAILRFCLKVMGHTENDMVLPSGSFKAGFRATMFRRQKDRGVGYLSGEHDDPRIVKAFYIDGPAADRIVTRARAIRAAAGTLSGYAIGDDLDSTPEIAAAGTLLDDIAAALAVIPSDQGEDKVWSETIISRLAELRPGVYDGWAPEMLAAALKPYGITTTQAGRRVEGEFINRRGLVRAHIAAAIAERDRHRSQSTTETHLESDTERDRSRDVG